MLSPREQDTLDFIQRFIQNHRHGPLLTEVALGIGIKSKGTVHRYIQALANAGYITLHSGRHRGIALTDISQNNSTTINNADYTLPVLGRIAAGQPIEAIADTESINLADFFMGPDRFVLHVSGDSMIEAGILDGDMVIIQRADHAPDGCIVVALIDDNEATLKRLGHSSDGSIMLIAENHTIPPMIYPAERVRIQGRLVGQMRRYN